MDFVHYFTAFAVSLVVAFGIMPAVIRVAHRVGAVDHPGERRAHSGSIPRLGGIGIFVAFVAGVGASTVVAGRAGTLSGPVDYNWPGVALGMCVIFLAGLIDDLRGLRPSTKLAFQTAAAAIAVLSGFRIDLISSPFGGSIDLGSLGVWVTFGWILLVINAMNLIDGLDGLAGGLALIVTTTVAAVALTMDQFGVVISALALAGAVTGFLRYNFAPAQIFMGDAGSQFLGYVLAVISIRGSQKGATAVAILVPLLSFGLPIMDVLMAVFRRVRSGSEEQGKGPLAMLRRVSRPDREHLHHNLLDLGLSPRRAALALYLIAAAFALSGYLTLVHNSLYLAVLTMILSVGSVAVIKIVLAGARGRLRAGHSGGHRPV